MSKKKKGINWDAYRNEQVKEAEQKAEQSRTKRENDGFFVRAFKVLGECFRRAVTPFIMYLFMGTLLLFVEAEISDQTSRWVLFACVMAFSIGFNAYPAVQTGMDHYRMLITGNIRRYNGIFTTSKEYKPQCEYRFYKGILIGVCICSIMIAVCLLSYLPSDGLSKFCSGAVTLLYSWAVVPASWVWAAMGNSAEPLSMLLVMAFSIIPIVTTGVSYCAGKVLAIKKQEEKDRRAALTAPKKKKS